jgi:hypothetical protein
MGGEFVTSKLRFAYGEVSVRTLPKTIAITRRFSELSEGRLVALGQLRCLAKDFFKIVFRDGEYS